jgi:serine protease Do
MSRSKSVHAPIFYFVRDNRPCLNGDTLDGDGYIFQDLLGKHYSYLISSDNSFLYAFDSYAGSYAPIRIQQLVGDQLLNVTKEPQFQRRLLQSLYSLEELSKKSDDSWHSNGFLAGWVASSILAGRGDAAQPVDILRSR